MSKYLKIEHPAIPRGTAGCSTLGAAGSLVVHKPYGDRGEAVVRLSKPRRSNLFAQAKTSRGLLDEVTIHLS